MPIRIESIAALVIVSLFIIPGFITLKVRHAVSRRYENYNKIDKVLYSYLFSLASLCILYLIVFLFSGSLDLILPQLFENSERPALIELNLQYSLVYYLLLVFVGTIVGVAIGMFEYNLLLPLKQGERLPNNQLMIGHIANKRKALIHLKNGDLISGIISNRLIGDGYEDIIIRSPEQLLRNQDGIITTQKSLGDFLYLPVDEISYISAENQEWANEDVFDVERLDRVQESIQGLFKETPNPFKNYQPLELLDPYQKGGDWLERKYDKIPPIMPSLIITLLLFYLLPIITDTTYVLTLLPFSVASVTWLLVGGIIPMVLIIKYTFDKGENYNYYSFLILILALGIGYFSFMQIPIEYAIKIGPVLIISMIYIMIFTVSKKEYNGRSGYVSVLFSCSVSLLMAAFFYMGAKSNFSRISMFMFLLVMSATFYYSIRGKPSRRLSPKTAFTPLYILLFSLFAVVMHLGLFAWIVPDLSHTDIIIFVTLPLIISTVYIVSNKTWSFMTKGSTTVELEIPKNN
ncbi:DUF6338 family protein [Natronocalculus amylovorans]|uniref:DUF6338 family protein n=1 Tax=Natronocalculus amylovorans TaxID=2917812 RepID=A0AAE3FZN1_9EURY|nr:DUF6338 family protein [Natronocalculus amylovorans]MCL9818317.1 DUF6338 family protein [Natronocalculus amylovorans]